MTSESLINSGVIEAIRIFIGTTTKDILATECQFMELAKDGNGIWYKFKSGTQIVPTEEYVFYVPMSGIVQIAFKYKQ